MSASVIRAPWSMAGPNPVDRRPAPTVGSDLVLSLER
jgi:hypothetical protein